MEPDRPQPGPARDPPRAKPKEAAAISPAQAHAIRDAFAGHPLEALVVTTLSTGLREGELLGLRWDDVDLEARSISVLQQIQCCHGEGRSYMESTSE